MQYENSKQYLSLSQLISYKDAFQAMIAMYFFFPTQEFDFNKFLNVVRKVRDRMQGNINSKRKQITF